MSKALFGAGCFWGPEKKFSEIKGVIETQVGYSQGLTDKTTYEEVCTGNTNHAEVVFLTFDEEKISYKNLVEFFYQIHGFGRKTPLSFCMRFFLHQKLKKQLQHGLYYLYKLLHM